jgi:SMI1 / KNR4 family (SUKH-1)
MRQLNWLEPGHEIDASVVHGAQQELGLEFPRDYVDFIRQHNDASNPRESSFPLVREGRRTVSNFGALISLQRHAAEMERHRNPDIYGTIRMLGKQLPDRVVPFALTGSGDFICFDYRSDKDNPAVVYFSHDAAFTERAIIPLASGFSAFLDLLYLTVDP